MFVFHALFLSYGCSTSNWVLRRYLVVQVMEKGVFLKFLQNIFSGVVFLIDLDINGHVYGLIKVVSRAFTRVMILSLSLYQEIFRNMFAKWT